MSDADLIALVEEILEVPSGTVGLADDLERLGWDSLSNLTFISIADERYGARIDPDALASASTPAELGALLPQAAQ